jgi:pyruvate,water dikinase
MKKKFILPFEKVGIADVALVGGKNASLGEMITHLTPKGVKVPSGFIITAEAYRHFLKETKLDVFIKETLFGLNTSHLADLSRRGELIRTTITKTDFPVDLRDEIIEAYHTLEQRYGARADVAVRSSATAEDLPGASFAGEHETYLDITGTQELLPAVRAAWRPRCARPHP